MHWGFTLGCFMSHVPHAASAHTSRVAPNKLRRSIMAPAARGKRSSSFFGKTAARTIKMFPKAKPRSSTKFGVFYLTECHTIARSTCSRQLNDMYKRNRLTLIISEEETVGGRLKLDAPFPTKRGQSSTTNQYEWRHRYWKGLHKLFSNFYFYFCGLTMRVRFCLL